MGPTDLILVPGFVSHVEVAWEEPRLAHFLGRLASFSRLIVFDKRGTGMSDPVERRPSMDQRMDDIRAVMDAAGLRRSHAVRNLGGRHAQPAVRPRVIPDGPRRWSCTGPGPVALPARDYPYGPSAEQLEEIDRRDGPGVGIRRMVGRRSAEPGRRCAAPHVVGPLPADGGEPGHGAERHPHEHADGHT